MDNKILWVSEKPVDYGAIARQFPLFQKRFEAYTKEPIITRRKDDGVFRMPAKAGTIRTCAAACSDEHQSWEDYEIHIKDIREVAKDLGCSSIVLDSEAAPPPIIAWLSRWDDRRDRQYDYIPVFIHWRNRLHFLTYINMEQEI